MDRFDARKRSAEILKERGLFLKEEPYENTVGFSERANEAIEPRLSEQWFLKYPNIPEALALLRNGHVKFHPRTGPRSTSTGSRTSRIGASRARSGGAIGFRFGTRTVEGKLFCQIDSPGEGWTQDPDSLDTWFSSWLWAYETMRTDDGTRKNSIPPTRSSPGRTSFSSGSPAC